MTEKFRPKTTPTGYAPLGKAAAPKPVTTVDLALATLAAQIRQCYGRERSAWESLRAGTEVAYICPARYDGREAISLDGALVLDPAVESVWLRLAKWFLRRKIPAEAYVQTQFECSLAQERAPEPLQLIGEKYLTNWQVQSPRQAERIAAALFAEKEEAETHFSVLTAYPSGAGKQKTKPRLAWAFILRNVNGNDLSPLFRYCLARRLGGERFEAIAEQFLAAAVLQFQRDPFNYGSCWAGFLPKDFAKLAERIYPQLLARM